MKPRYRVPPSLRVIRVRGAVPSALMSQLGSLTPARQLTPGRTRYLKVDFVDIPETQCPRMPRARPSACLRPERHAAQARPAGPRQHCGGRSCRRGCGLLRSRSTAAGTNLCRDAFRFEAPDAPEVVTVPVCVGQAGLHMQDPTPG